jgi:hypothetical protein
VSKRHTSTNRTNSEGLKGEIRRRSLKRHFVRFLQCIVAGNGKINNYKAQAFCYLPVPISLAVPVLLLALLIMSVLEKA